MGQARWGIELRGGEGFRAIARAAGLGRRVPPARRVRLAALDERFDLVYCFGILHRVENPLGAAAAHPRAASRRGGNVLVETYGSTATDNGAAIDVLEPGAIYPGDDYVYWGFGAAGLTRLAAHAGFASVEVIDRPIVDGHPRILASMRAA